MADNKFIIEVGLEGDGESKMKRLVVAVKETGEEIKKTAKKAEEAGDSFGKVGKEIDAFKGKFTDIFNVSAGVVAAEAIIGTFNAVKDAAVSFFKTMVVEGVAAAQKQEDANTNLNIALKATGQFSAEASEHLIELASALEQSSKFSSDAIVNSQSLLQNMAKLSTDGLDKATRATVDLAAALNIDLEKATSLVGKAASGEGVAGFKRYGISIEEGATKAQTFANTLQALSQFQGAAAAQLNTYSGATGQASNAFEDIGKELGSTIIQNQSLISVIKAATSIFRELEQKVKDNKGAINQFISDGIVYLIDSASFAISALQAMQIGFLKLQQAAVAAQVGVSATANVITLGMTDAGKRVDDGVTKFEQLERQIKKLETESTGPLDKVQEGLLKLRNAAEQGIGKTADGADRATTSLRAMSAATEELTKKQEAQIAQGVKLATESPLKANDPQIQFENEQLALEAALDAKKITHEQFNEALVQITATRNEKIAENETKLVDQLLLNNEKLSQNGSELNQAAISSNNEKIREILQNENLSATQRNLINQRLADYQKKIEVDRANAISGSIGQLASLQNAKSKELAAVGKAAAIAQTTIDTYRGATGAAAALAGIPIVGPALAAAAAAAFVVAGLARVAQISGTPLAGGITEIPAGFPNDSFPARLQTGERVVDANANADLKGFLGGANQMVPLLASILHRLNAMEMQVNVYLSSGILVEAVRVGLESGRTLDVRI